MSSIGKEIGSAIRSELSSVMGIDIGTLARGLRNELISQIQGADMPEGVKNALINSISFKTFGDDRATVTVSAMRSSIYAHLGLYTEPVDLALIYDNRKQIKRSAIYFDPDNPGMGVIPVGRIKEFARGYTNNYLQKAANAFMAKHPECIVTVTR